MTTTGSGTPILKPPVPPSSQQQQPQQPLLLTIRFSAALPDLELDIPYPGTTTVVSLKHLIRSRLSEPNSQRRLRFIHGGKILPDGAVLSAVLKPPLPPPPPPSSSAGYTGGGYGYGYGYGSGAKESGTGGDETGSGKGKGKSVPGRPLQRIYVNCSIGDSLTSAELSAEAVAAAAPPSSNSNSNSSTLAPGSSPPGGVGAATGPTTTTTTTPAPRGFDRLLSAGLTPAEVNQLRLQFRSIHASRYTPDTLPSPDSFRRMEDEWIDSSPGHDHSNNNNGGGGFLAGSNGGAIGGMGGTDTDEFGAGDAGAGIAGTIDVLVRGVVTGFLWPLGSGAWLMREEGMASGRSRFMVGVGVLFSVLIGVIRAISGEG
ncbi:hypothetical protein DL769_001047 [Monosporascus sp. CRB-8-3]|nr:hypothetical protein DL769_001047 [Monosporascus sp. CRB-8-3]